MKILLFGGTFDPPHNGHLTLLRSCADAVQPDQVRIIPAGVPPHKGASTASARQRLDMCRAFAALLPGAEVDPRELERPGKSYTVDTLRQLQEELPTAELYLCLGSDMLRSFFTWHCYREILERAVLVAHLRDEAEGGPLREAADRLREQGARVIETGGPVLTLSSSEIRAMCTRGEDISPLVPPEVFRYIQQHQLYREGERYRVDYGKRLRKLGKKEIEP